jgi:integrase
MSRHHHRLTPKALKLRERGMYADGGGLYLQVSVGVRGRINRSWIYRYTVGSKDHLMGLGSCDTVKLDEAREKARQARLQRLTGVDPLAAKHERQRAQHAEQAAQAVTKAKLLTFNEAADAYVAAHAAGWRSPRHKHDWEKSIELYVSPVMGKVGVTDIDHELVLKCLRPIWQEKFQTASRLRARIEQVLNYAVDYGTVGKLNPARWKGHLEHKLDKRLRKVKGVKHMAALPYADMPAFWERLRAEDRISYTALRFIILTAARSGEALQARWSEIDLAGKVWVIPKERMKSHREHRVALNDAAVELLQGLPRTSEFVFPGERAVTVSGRLLPKQLKAMGYNVTVHGFRSTFRDWAAERTNFTGDVAEAALAHAVGDATERAYQRGDLFEKRSKLMNAWANYLTTPPAGNVVLLKTA